MSSSPSNMEDLIDAPLHEVHRPAAKSMAVGLSR